jgi:hypothetical protein
VVEAAVENLLPECCGAPRLEPRGGGVQGEPGLCCGSIFIGRGLRPSDGARSGAARPRAGRRCGRDLVRVRRCGEAKSWCRTAAETLRSRAAEPDSRSPLSPRAGDGSRQRRRVGRARSESDSPTRVARDRGGWRLLCSSSSSRLESLGH